MMKSRGDNYMVLLQEKTLEMKVMPFEEGIKPLYKFIECESIDHSSAIDALNDNDIDMWVDDEGLLKSRCPVFVFFDDEDKITGQLVGNIVFQKSDYEGESCGMTEEEAYRLIAWVDAHDRVKVELYNGTICECFIIRSYETNGHRQKIADMVQWAKDNDWQVFKM